MRNLLILSFLTLFQLGNLSEIFCQNEATTFTATASKTEILLGNILEITFELKGNQGGKFTPPDFDTAGFKIRGGPNQSSSFSMINGVTNYSISYSYFLVAKKEGELVIPEATMDLDGEILNTKPLTIKVLPNPDGQIENEENDENPQIFEQPKPEAKPKTKRKTTRI